MARQCRGFKRDGSRCTTTVNPPQTLCWWHDPANAEQRRRSASKAGRAKPNREIFAIRTRLSDLADDVLAGRVNRADAAVAGQLLGTVIRAVGMELKVKEAEDFERRLEELEEYFERQQAAQGGSGKW